MAVAVAAWGGELMGSEATGSLGPGRSSDQYGVKKAMGSKWLQKQSVFKFLKKPGWEPSTCLLLAEVISHGDHNSHAEHLGGGHKSVLSPFSRPQASHYSHLCPNCF